METKNLRWAVVGSGVISAQFSDALAKVSGNEKYALISRNVENAGPFARQHGFSRVLPLNDRSFSLPEIDAIYIGTPTSTHRDLCIRAALAGKPFLCEKPMTGSSEEFEEVLQVLRDHPVYAMEAMWLKFNPLIGRISEYVAYGRSDSRLGTPTAAFMQIGYRDQAAHENCLPSADALTVFGCYGFALALALFGEPRRIFCHGQTGATMMAMLKATVLLDFDDFLFSIDCSVISELANSLQVRGTQGVVSIPASVIDPYRFDVSRQGRRGTLGKIGARLAPFGGAVIDLAASRHPLRGSGFRGEISSTQESIARGLLENERHPLSATGSVHRIMESARLSHEQGRWVDLRKD